MSDTDSPTSEPDRSTRGESSDADDMTIDGSALLADILAGKSEPREIRPRSGHWQPTPTSCFAPPEEAGPVTPNGYQVWALVLIIMACAGLSFWWLIGAIS